MSCLFKTLQTCFSSESNEIFQDEETCLLLSTELLVRGFGFGRFLETFGEGSIGRPILLREHSGAQSCHVGHADGDGKGLARVAVQEDLVYEMTLSIDHFDTLRRYVLPLGQFEHVLTAVDELQGTALQDKSVERSGKCCMTSWPQGPNLELWSTTAQPCLPHSRIVMYFFSISVAGRLIRPIIRASRLHPACAPLALFIVGI